VDNLKYTVRTDLALSKNLFRVTNNNIEKTILQLPIDKILRFLHKKLKRRFPNMSFHTGKSSVRN
jgi:hypothetical protein